MRAEELIEAAGASSWERLKWRVRRELCLPPGAAAEMSRGEYLLCAAHMILDAREGGRGARGEANPAFDEARFRKLREGADCE